MRRARDVLEPARLNSDINVTPFIDVMLVLLVIFMVTMPMMLAGRDLQLPSSAAAPPLVPPPQPVTVSMDRDGNLALGDAPVAEDALVAQLAERMKAHPDLVVYVRGDGDVSYKRIVALLDELAKAGVTRVSLVEQSTPAGAP